jgi:hypothetical protein
MSTSTTRNCSEEEGKAENTLETVPIEALDPNIVGWDGSGDAQNPHNWSSGKRWAHIILVSVLGLVTYVGSQ